MKARPAKTSEHKALESTKVITHRQSKHNMYVRVIAWPLSAKREKACNNTFVTRSLYS